MTRELQVAIRRTVHSRLQTHARGAHTTHAAQDAQQKQAAGAAIPSSSVVTSVLVMVIAAAMVESQSGLLYCFSRILQSAPLVTFSLRLLQSSV